MLHDDFLDDGEAQAGAVGFGGVEGAEDFAASLGGDARTIVEDGDALEAGVLSVEQIRRGVRRGRRVRRWNRLRRRCGRD